MAAKCDQLSCCNNLNYKVCEHILCGDGLVTEESHQCDIPGHIKSVDCFCVLLEYNCRRFLFGDDLFGIDTDEGQTHIWVENGCQGFFRVCHQKVRSQCHPGTTNSTTTSTSLPPTTATRRFSGTTSGTSKYTTQMSSISDDNNGGNPELLLGLPLALVVVVMAILALLYRKNLGCLWNRKKKRKNSQSKKNATYMNSMAADDDMVYDEINDNKNSNTRQNMPIYMVDSTNMTDPNKVGTRGNAYYSLQEQEGLKTGKQPDLVNANANYYITPPVANTDYFVLEKDNSSDDLQQEERKVYTPHAPTETNGNVDYFILEKTDENQPQTTTANIKGIQPSAPPPPTDDDNNDIGMTAETEPSAPPQSVEDEDEIGLKENVNN